MLIDDSQSSNSIQNVSYLIPIGICLFAIISSFKGLVITGFEELAMRYEMDAYLSYWLIHLGTIVLISVVSFFLVRRVWRRIVNGEFNCARLFVSILILTVISIGITELGQHILRIFMDLRYENGYSYQSGYMEFLRKISTVVWGVEFVILVSVITLAVRSPRKVHSSE